MNTHFFALDILRREPDTVIDSIARYGLYIHSGLSEAEMPRHVVMAAQTAFVQCRNSDYQTMTFLAPVDVLTQIERDTALIVATLRSQTVRS